MTQCFSIIIILFFFFLNEFIFFIIDILILANSIWTTKAIKILYCIYFAFICARFIQTFSFVILSCFDKCKKLYEKMTILFGILYCLLIIFWIFELIIITINYTKFTSYWKNCPYLLSDLEYNIHFKRRCELYNINNNSRYSYQYICSYDSSKDFKNDFSKKIESNNIICVPFNESIIENYYNYDIIILFTNEYKDEKKFFCSRTNIPEKNSSIKDKDCNNKKFRYMIATVILPYLRIICIFWPLLIIYIMPDTARENRNFFLRNFESISRQSTKISEISRGNEDFVKQNTQNIIIENKEEFKINTNIKNIETNNNINNIESNIENIELNLYNIKDENKSNSN